MSKSMIPLTISHMGVAPFPSVGSRIAAIILDFIYMSPIFLFVAFKLNNSFNEYITGTILTFLISIIFNIVIVLNWGGSPGKLTMGMKIISIDGNKIHFVQAILREIIDLFIAIVSAYAFASFISSYGDEYFSLNFMEKGEFIAKYNPSQSYIQYLTWAWYLAELICIIINKRRRSISDLIAGTVVIKKIVQKDIEEAMAGENNE